MISPKELWPLVKEAVSAWLEDRAASMGAALAYYTAFSIASLLIIAIAVAGLVFGRDAAQGAVVSQLQGLLGDAGGSAIEEILKSTANFGSSVLAMAIGVGALILTATTAFVELQDDLDRIWKAEPRAGGGVVNLIRSRLLSFGMVLFIGFLLAVSLILSAGVAALGNSMFSEMEVLLQAITFVVSFAVITVLFAMIYKVLPNVKIDWEDVWVGAAITALLFEMGKVLVGLYIGKSSAASSFGAAGPFVVLMLWIYYSTQIFLLGAEFTFAYAHRGQLKPTEQAAAVALDHGPSSMGTSPLVAGQNEHLPPSLIPSQPSVNAGWAIRAGAVAAAGLVTGLTATRLIRNSLKSR
jgi:membrane protein